MVWGAEYHIDVPSQKSLGKQKDRGASHRHVHFTTVQVELTIIHKLLQLLITKFLYAATTVVETGFSPVAKTWDTIP